MTQVDVGSLNREFGRGEHVRFDEARGGLTRALLSTEQGRAEVYLLGAHVTGYWPSDQEDVLFLSQLARFVPGEAIRGGVPICFPWFAVDEENPQAPKHGTVCRRIWEVEQTWGDGSGAGMVLRIQEGVLAVRYEVTVDDALSMRMQVQNTGETSERFEQALHTYFRVSDVEQIAVHGLANKVFFDKNADADDQRADDPLRFTGPTDRVYQDAGQEHVIDDPGLHRRIVITREHARSTVVWNPWSDQVGRFDDLGQEEWRRMVCVEAGNVKSSAVELDAGASHTMVKRLTVRGM